MFTHCQKQLKVDSDKYQQTLPRIGGLLTGDREPFDYLNRSIDSWFSPDEFAGMLSECGFADVGYDRLSLGTVALHWGTRPSA